MPSAVVECLASEKSIDLVPLPPVETIPRDEDTDVFREALREAKAVDPEWLAAEDAKRAAGSRRRSKDKAAERSLRDRVRAQLGMPEWRAATDPKVRAQELGQRFHGLNHIRLPRQVCMTRCGRRGGD
jgi:hypothetical protein